MPLQFHITEKAEGDFRLTPETDREEYAKRLLPLVKEYSGKEKVFVLRTDFTRDVVFPDSRDWRSSDDRLRINTKPADGIVISNRETALVLLNADCPGIFLEQGVYFGALHGGLKCLFPTSPTQPSIIKVALQHFFDPKRVTVTVAGGIGPCCYGMESFIREQNGALKLPTAAATRGKRKGQQSIDLYRLILAQLRELGVPDDSVTIDPACTSCQTTTGLAGAPPKHFSHVQGDDERNALIISRE